MLKMHKSIKLPVMPSTELFVNNHQERDYMYLYSAKNQKRVVCKLSAFNQMLVFYHRTGLEVTSGKQVT